MDQGLAAVLGAAVGVVGTLGTACFTYLATRQQTRDRERVEHGQWLRQQRQQAYENFLIAYDRFAAAATAVEDALQGPRTEGYEDYVAALKDAMDAFGSARVRVAVAGPHFASQSAGRIAVLFSQTLKSLQAWGEAQASGGDVSETSSQLHDVQGRVQLAYRDFVRDARSILETPPSTPGRTSGGNPFARRADLSAHDQRP
ncbi:hypothetical protein [Streptomyces tropicalis]|uniref:Secreted protein n=1 Tax=Streptomyces tropicalis TaxID=3034234 RepID=A0ABT6A6C1_9ACTN|nr:hypothetical protein [Streptomyces tropicalis]MDF3300195.1 hypothetical protein [Streptomyces tropicalis]